VTLISFGTRQEAECVEDLLLNQAKRRGESLKGPIFKTCEELAIRPTLSGYTETFSVDNNTFCEFQRELQRFLSSEQVAAGFMNFPAELAAEVLAFMQLPKPEFIGAMIRHVKNQ